MQGKNLALHLTTLIPRPSEEECCLFAKATVGSPTSYSVLMFFSPAPVSLVLSCSAPLAGTLELTQGRVQARAEGMGLQLGINPLSHPFHPSIGLFLR